MAASARARLLGSADGTTVGWVSSMLGTAARVLVSNTKKVQAYTVASGNHHRAATAAVGFRTSGRNGSLDLEHPRAACGRSWGRKCCMRYNAKSSKRLRSSLIAGHTSCTAFMSTLLAVTCRCMRKSSRLQGIPGALHVDDPDDVCGRRGDGVSPDLAHSLLDTSPAWVREPFATLWLAQLFW